MINRNTLSEVLAQIRSYKSQQRIIFKKFTQMYKVSGKIHANKKKKTIRESKLSKKKNIFSNSYDAIVNTFHKRQNNLPAFQNIRGFITT